MELKFGVNKKQTFVKQHNVRKQFLLFFIIGSSCTLLNLIVMWYLTDELTLHYLVATLISFVCINPISFVLSRFFAFRGSQVRPSISFLRYFFGAGFNLLIVLFFSYILVHYAHIHYLLVSLLMSGLLMVINFIFHRHISFGFGKKFKKVLLPK